MGDKGDLMTLNVAQFLKKPSAGFREKGPKKEKKITSEWQFSG